MKNLREFAKEQENERLREMAFQEWALPRIKENFGVPGYDLELRKEYEMINEAAETYAKNDLGEMYDFFGIESEVTFKAGVDWYMGKSYSMAEVFSILMSFSASEKNSSSESISKFLEQYKK